MPTSSRLPSHVDSTPPFAFVSGFFKSGGWTIPYFATTLSADEAIENLKVAEDLPGADFDDWSMSELFQREIDWGRVQRDIRPYLRNEGVPHFFNALTVTLVPIDPTTGRIANSFENGTWLPPEADEGYECIPAGPVMMAWHKGNSQEQGQDFDPLEAQEGFLKWNRHQVFALTIDGQHRLAAVKREGNSRHNNLRLPILFLLLHEAVGFEAPALADGSRQGIRSISRSLFIDINKHAVKVNPARQILLDDFDVNSRCVRSLIEEKLTEGLSALDEDPPKLPLSVVDWMTEQARFQDSAFMTTVLGLHEQVKNLMKSTPGPMEWSAWKKKLRGWQKQLDVDLTEQIQMVEDRENKRSFSLDDGDLKIIEEGFARRYAGFFCAVLTEFQAYRDLLELRERNGSLSREWQWWLKLTLDDQGRPDEMESRVSKFLGDLEASDSGWNQAAMKGALESIQDFKATKGLSFYVVYQRALFDACLHWTETQDYFVDDSEHVGNELTPEELEAVFGEEGEDEDAEIESEDTELPAEDNTENDRSLGASAQEFIRTLNDVHRKIPDLLQLRGRVPDSNGRGELFWLGSLANVEEQDAIDYTKEASGRATYLLYAVAWLQWLKNQQGERDFSEIWAELIDGNSSSRAFHPMRTNVRKLYKAKDKQHLTMGGRCLTAKEVDYKEFEAGEEVRIRLEAVWNAL